MLKPLRHDLFVEGEPLRADNWNELVDASVMVVDAMSVEHRDGFEHASGRFEQGFMSLEWGGSQWDVSRADRLDIQQSFQVDALTDELELGFSGVEFLSGWDYGAIVVSDVGMVGVTLEAPEADGFRVHVPRGDTYNIERLEIFVYGKRVKAPVAPRQIPAESQVLGLPLIEGGTGEVVSVEVLQEARQKHQALISDLQRDHDWDGKGGLGHISPMWAEAVALVEVSNPMTRPTPIVQPVWSEGFKIQPHGVSRGRIEWELERDGPQSVQIGFTSAADPWPFNFERDLHFRCGSHNGKGWLELQTSNLSYIDQHEAYEAMQSISRILIVSRVF